MASEESNSNNNTFKRYTEVKSGWTVRGSNASRGKRFYLLNNVQTGSGTHPASYSMDTGGFSPVVKRQGRDVYTHLAPRLGVRGAVTLLPPMLLHSVYRKKITFSQRIDTFLEKIY
jgi:hypothetical protein